MLNGNKNISLDEILADPGRARALPRSVRSDLLARCAAVIITLSSGDDSAEVKPAAPVTGGQQTVDNLLTVPEVAKRLGFAASYVYEMLRRGDLPAVHHKKFVRVLESALTKFIANHEQRGALPRRVSDMLQSRA